MNTLTQVNTGTHRTTTKLLGTSEFSTLSSQAQVQWPARAPNERIYTVSVEPTRYGKTRYDVTLDVQTITDLAKAAGLI